MRFAAEFSRFDAEVFHYCLRAPVDVVHHRRCVRGDDPANAGWSYQRAIECCEVHASPAFATHIDAADRSPDEIASDILGRVVK